MEIQHFIEQKKELYENFINYIDNSADINIDFQVLMNTFEIQQTFIDHDEIKLLLHLISKISLNHHRSPDFFNKIETILSQFENQIKQTFTNAEIFNIFRNNKKILLYFLQKKIISFDESFLPNKTRRDSYTDFCRYFFPEVNQFLNDEERESIENDKEFLTNFDQKRKTGENDSYICSLIRNDSIDDFVSYVNQSNYPFSSTIKPSPFETNSFLIKNKNTTLIEYAAFFGSIKIFNYLRMNKVKLTESLWLYAIHSNNAELIHLLEENHIKYGNNKLLKESIKCHHNQIANYIQNNFLNENEVIDNFNENVYKYAFHYYNYSYFPSDFKHEFVFHYLCQYDYFKLVKLYLKTYEVNINETVIQEVSKAIFF